ncbi:MAG: hypothetical protein AB7P23_00100 [Amphiplicatus sp.]
MAWHRIWLERARTPDFNGAAQGFEMTAPLDERSVLDVLAWGAAKEKATVRRLSDGEAEAVGILERTFDGNWMFSCAPRGHESALRFRLKADRLAVGDYVSIGGPNGETLPFRIVSATPAEESTRPEILPRTR